MSESRWWPASSLNISEAAVTAIQCIDTDPVNRTFSQYSGLEASRLELMRDGSIDIRGFDRLMERLLTEDGIFVIDNGASTFIPLWSYIVENQVIDILREAGKRLYVHTVITGGQALLDTVNGFRSLAQSTTDQNVIVWINEYFGRVERDGKTFPDMAAYIGERRQGARLSTYTQAESGHVRARRRGCHFEEAHVRRGNHERGILDHDEAAAKGRAARSVRATERTGNLMIDQKRLIGEVAAKNGIRLEPDDPAFALVTLNETVLQDTVGSADARDSASLQSFAESLEKTENRAGKVLAQDVKVAAAELRRELNSDIENASLKANELV